MTDLETRAAAMVADIRGTGADWYCMACQSVVTATFHERCATCGGALEPERNQPTADLIDALLSALAAERERVESADAYKSGHEDGWDVGFEHGMGR
jgi:hypothetical protein